MQKQTEIRGQSYPNYLNRPSDFKIATSLLFEKIMPNKFNSKTIIPLGYTFFQKIKKTTGDNNYKTFLAKKNNKTYFMKQWSGVRRGYGYYSLFNEYNNSKILSELSERSGVKSIKILQATDLIVDNTSITLIYPYIKGKSLNQFNIKFQKITKEKFINLLNHISTHNTDRFSNFLDRKSRLPLTSFIFLLSILFKKNINISRVKMVKIYISSIIRYSKIHDSEIAHRDIVPSNIIVNRDQSFLLDCEKVAISPKGYDKEYIFVQDVVNSKKVNFIKYNNPLVNFVIFEEMANSNSKKEIHSLASMLEQYE
jgi:serine/threonine protein kinase